MTTIPHERRVVPTSQQTTVLRLIHQRLQQQGYGPSLQELAEDAGSCSRCRMHQHVQRLVALGYLVVGTQPYGATGVRAIPRSMRLTPAGYHALGLEAPAGSGLVSFGEGGDSGGGGSVVAPAPSESASPAADGTLPFTVAYSTAHGTAFCGDSLAVLPHLIEQGVRVKLLVTSPPFALVRQKDYGNEDADSYLRWFHQFIPLFRDVLAPDGSLVIDIGGAWIKGLPCKSVYQFKVLLDLIDSGFYLAQDFYHYNPAKLPTPAEWVTVRRLRVKDAINNVWWLTREPFIPSDNRRVLRPYSESMEYLLQNGYSRSLRPSGHDISDKFQKDNGGAIPPNLLSYSNTESNSYYLRRCREEGIKPHPARFPQALPEFFINFLTNPGDLVLDPFAGSNVTGAAAEALGRQWLSCELDPMYVRASQFRFEAGQAAAPDTKKRNGAVPSSLKLAAAAP